MSENINWASIASVLDQIKEIPAHQIIDRFFDNLLVPSERQHVLMSKWEKTKGDLGWFISSLKVKERESLYEYLNELYDNEGN